ncbi:MAG: M24 family metallopeptidase [Candidatus Thorarchaeota archaeon]|jgi:methionine aminopeptidase
MVSRGLRFVVAIVLFLLMVSVTTTDAITSNQKKSVILSSIDVADAAPASNITSEAMIEARHILRAAYEQPITQAGVSNRLEAMMLSEGADGDLSFPTLVMSGSELSVGHGNPFDDTSHVIDPTTEPIVMIDMGSKYNGFCSDVTRTFFYETATQEMFDAYNAVLTAHEAVIAAVGPGVQISDLDAILEVYLTNYTGVPGVSLLTYWGHGVGEHVHEMPLLFNVAEELQVDDVIAIEPGIYFETGWAVRIEDTVRVTETGVEVLSNVPKALEDVMILQSQPYVDADITVTDYDYGFETVVEVSVSDSATRAVLGVDWFDGYSWTPMNHMMGSNFNFSYGVDYSYSGRLDCMSRVHLTNDTYYFREVVTSSVETSGSHEFNPPNQYSDTILPPDSQFLLSIAEPGAEMMRIRFRSMTGGFDQLLIEDASSRPVIDYNLVSDTYLWTPWVTGDTLKVHVVQTEPEFLGGIDEFSFSIDRIEFFDMDLPPQTTTTTTTTTVTGTTSTTTSTITSTTTSTSPPPDEDSWHTPTLVFMGSIAFVVLVVVFLYKKRI